MAIGTPSSTAPLTAKVNTGITSCPNLRELTRTSTVWQNGQQRKKISSKGESTAPSSSYVPPTGGFLGIGRTQPSAEFGVGEVLVMYVRRDMEIGEKKGGVEIAGTVMDESVIGDDGVIGR